MKGAKSDVTEDLFVLNILLRSLCFAAYGLAFHICILQRGGEGGVWGLGP